MNNALRAIGLVVALAMLPIGFAFAGEVRFDAILGAGGSVVVDEDDNDLAASQTSKRLSASYYFGQAAPFLAVAVGKEEFDNFAYNGNDLPGPAVKADSRLVTAGYRTGTTGQTQFLFQASRLLLDFDSGANADTTSVGLGVERDFETWRVRVLGNVDVGENPLVLEDETRFRIDLQGTWFPLAELGLNAGVGYSSGVVDLGSRDGTSAEFSLRLGVELRLRPG